MLSEIFRRSNEEQVGGGWSRRSRKRTRRLLRTGAIIAGVLILALLVARPVRSMVHVWQSRRHAQNAFSYIDQHKWKEARQEATAAYQLRPGEPEAIRAVARLLSRAGDIGALNFWRVLAE